LSPDSLAKAGAPTPYYDSNPENPDYAVGQSYGGLSNQNGYAAVSYVAYSRYSPEHYSPNYIYSFKTQPDGSFGPPEILYKQSNDYANFGGEASLIDINKNNAVLARVDNPIGSSSRTVSLLLGDLNSGGFAFLPTSIPSALSATSSAFSGMNLDYAKALDDQGRVLFAGDRQVGGQTELDTILLTPAGLSSSPIPTPEPTTLITLGVLSLGLLIRGRRGR
jgi:hypothetical protein